MRKFFCFITLLAGVTFSVSAQIINEYRYVKVPEKFDFLKEENKHQLNALTAFLFEKYGFEVLYKKEIPREADPCDVLQANVHDKSNIFRAKLYVSLENCRNETVFKSQTGTSPEKDYKTSYHEALREAFASVEKLNYRFVATENNTSAENSESEELPGEVIVDPVVTAEEIEEEASRKTSSEGKTEISNLSGSRKYTNGAITYTLKDTPEGYELFKETEDEKFAGLIKSGGGENYLYSSKNISGNAFFDTHGNLIVEYVDPNSGQLVTVNYKLQAQ